MTKLLWLTKKSPSHHPSTTGPDSWYELNTYLPLDYVKEMLSLMIKNVHLGLICPKIIVSEALWFV